MLLHYLSLAWQQLEKYRLQSVVSIVSLAIGFACFALASMWIKYETTYDAFHEDVERIYHFTEGGFLNTNVFNPEKFGQLPEIETYTMYSETEYDSINGSVMKASERMVHDGNFPKVFTLQMIEGTDGFLHDEKQVAVSDRLARELWGDESPIGKELHVNSKLAAHKIRTVTGVFKDWGAHTNYPMDMLGKVPEGSYLMKYSVLKLQPQNDAATVRKKLLDMEHSVNFTPEIVPLTEYRKWRIERWTSLGVQANHIYLFALASLLLIACGLLNYLTMFINRLFIRKREIALRTMLGARGRDILLQFLVEYGLVLVIALFFGFIIVSACEKQFLALTELPVEANYIYQEIGIYSTVVTVFSLLVSLPIISYFRHQSLQSSIKGVGGIANYNSFRRISTGVQMCITIFGIFCVVVMMTQLDTLRHKDIGFKRENRACLDIEEANPGLRKSMVEEILFNMKQLPEIDLAYSTDNCIFPSGSFFIERLSPDDYPQLDKEEKLLAIRIGEHFAEFYEPTLLSGRWLGPGDERKNILINETTARTLGWEDPIGQIYYEKSVYPNKTYVVVGVIKDMLLSPTDKANNWVLHYHPGSINYHSRILFRYKPDTWPSVRKKITDLYAKNGWGTPVPTTFEEEYEKMLVSENKLQTLLSITTGVCILIALFGVWSMIMLTCEQRRKEIAVRKVFGATTKDILDMFFFEYMALQGVAALVAFPVGYACMKPWLEQYVVQTSIPWWIYVGIFMAVALLVAICVGWRVWKTATAHPADEICKG